MVVSDYLFEIKIKLPSHFIFLEGLHQIKRVQPGSALLFHGVNIHVMCTPNLLEGGHDVSYP
jgi:hypothetical protein